MPIGADFQKMLRSANARLVADFERQPAIEIARAFRTGPTIIPPVPQPVRVESRGIPGPGGLVPVRVYRPDGRGPTGVLVSFHGGGWVSGNLDSEEHKNHVLARAAGVAIVSVDYRLAPEHAFPAALDDGYAVLEWIFSNASALGFDPRRVGVGGGSAGGNLAAALSLMRKDRGGPALACQLLTYPVCDHDFDRPLYREDSDLSRTARQRMMWYFDQYAPAPIDRNSPYVSPLRAKDLTGLPPALIITAEFDVLRDEAEAYARLLQDAGVEVELTRYAGTVHGFVGFDVLHPESQRALRQVAAAMEKYLKVPGPG